MGFQELLPPGYRGCAVSEPPWAVRQVWLCAAASPPRRFVMETHKDFVVASKVMRHAYAVYIQGGKRSSFSETCLSSLVGSEHTALPESLVAVSCSPGRARVCQSFGYDVWAPSWCYCGYSLFGVVIHMWRSGAAFVKPSNHPLR